MDLLIINPKMSWFTNRSMISCGPLQLVSYLYNKKKFDVKVMDGNSIYRMLKYEDYVNYIKQYNPTVVGLSVSTLNAYTSYALAKELKRQFPDKIIIGGGLHSYDSPHEMIKQDFDVVFKGEAELSLSSFLNILSERFQQVTTKEFNEYSVLSEIRRIPGLVIKTDTEIIDTGHAEIIQNLDEIPFSNFDLVNLDDFIKTKLDHHYVTNCFNFQRGCPYNCNYCKSEILTSKMRSNSPQYIVNEIKYRYERFKFGSIVLNDSNFTIDKKRLKDFCSLMASSNLSKKVYSFIQSSISVSLNDDEIEMMKEAGITLFSLGVERFDDNFRRLMRKTGTGKQASDLIRQLHNRGIKVSINILINFPFETKEALKKEAQLLDEIIPHVDFFYVNYLLPMPGTQVYDEGPNSHYAQWYLRENIINHRMSYYDIAYLIGSPALALNPFNLSTDVIKEIRSFKEKYHKRGVFRLNESVIFRMVLILDLLLAKLSFCVAGISPRVENIIFSPLKFLRTQGYKFFYNKFVVSRN